MVERAARALCALEGLDPDAVGDAAEPVWRTRVGQAEAVLEATMLPPIGELPSADEGAAAAAALRRWAEYRNDFGVAGAEAREPTLQALNEWHVRGAWRTWNGMVRHALRRSG